MALNVSTALSMAQDSSGQVPEMAMKIVSHHSEASTYYIARKLMLFCDWLLSLIGQDHNKDLFIILYTAVVFALSIGVGMLVKWIVVQILNRLKPLLKYPLYHHLVERRFFGKTCRVIPPLLFLILIQFTLYMHSSIASWLTRLSLISIIIYLAISLCTLAEVIWLTVNDRENKKKLPLQGIVQVAKLITWIIAIITIAAILLDKSPAAVLAGLGAFAAVLMLIFKDSILGIVAGVQLAQNESLHVGDWISVPNGSANGIVDDVSLTDIKIINWDKTVSTVPPYNLITGGFKNYRNMQESNTRRIQRSLLIDADSVVMTTPDMLERFKQLPLMADWITKKQAEQTAGKSEDGGDPSGLVDGSLDTNLGVFRAYAKLYLDASHDVSHAPGDTCFITLLEQTASGIPLQVYCFTNTSNWTSYEAKMSAIFEHLTAMLHEFDLYTFENASGRATILEGYYSAGKEGEKPIGIPDGLLN